MKLAAALAVILVATTAQAHTIHKASPGCTAFAMAHVAHAEYLMHKSGADLTPPKEPGSYVMWIANNADKTQGEDWCWRELARLFQKK